MGHVPLSGSREIQALPTHQVVSQISVIRSASYGDSHQHGDLSGLFRNFASLLTLCFDSMGRDVFGTGRSVAIKSSLISLCPWISRVAKFTHTGRKLTHDVAQYATQDGKLTGFDL